MTSGAPKQPAIRDEDNVNPPTETEDAVDPRDIVRTGGTPENPEEMLIEQNVVPKQISSPGDLRSDIRKQE